MKAGKKSGKVVIWIILILIAAVIIAYAATEYKKRQALADGEPKGSGEAGSGHGGNSRGPTYVPPVFPLKMGSKGQEVQNVQKWLISKGELKGSADGSWGPATDEAVRNVSRKFPTVPGLYPALSEKNYQLMLNWKF